ncbi:hypothetical protein BVRB_6g147390 [Beta vulgaris subsp. vulgaris]|nr:hypothetical protein BVRB_6g147390 [Beta vulgaris subsp. vulgaris]
MKANKREQIQLGVPIFGQIKDDTIINKALVLWSNLFSGDN